MLASTGLHRLPCACLLQRKCLTHPTKTGFPCLYGRALPSWISSTSPMGCCVAGGLEFGAGLVRGNQHAPGVRLASVPPNQACCQHAWCSACVELCPLERQGSMIGGQIVPTHAMAKQLPLSQDVLWTQRSPVIYSICLSGLLRRLRLAMIDRHVSLLHAPKRNEYAVEGEFMGDLPAHVANQQPAARVGNADVCLIYLHPLRADQRLLRLPRSFMVGEDRVQIYRPGQRGLMPSQGQSASAGSLAVTQREVSRPIRTRQRAQRAARRAAQLPAVARACRQPVSGTGGDRWPISGTVGSRRPLVFGATTSERCPAGLGDSGGPQPAWSQRPQRSGLRAHSTSRSTAQGSLCGSSGTQPARRHGLHSSSGSRGPACAETGYRHGHRCLAAPSHTTITTAHADRGAAGVTGCPR